MSKFIKTDRNNFRFKVNTTHYGATSKVVVNSPETGFTDKVMYFQNGIMIGYSHDNTYWILGDIS